MTAPAEQYTQESWSEFPAGTSLVRAAAHVPDLATPQQIAAYAQAFDDEAFLAGIVGEAMDKWFYEFSVGGKKVEGVSVVGAEEFARLRAEQGFPIRFPPGSVRAEEVTQNGELGIRVTVIARDARSGAEGLGMAFYPYMVERERNGEKIRVPDNMPDRKCLSVAKRNAILDLIPTATIISVLKQRSAIVGANQQREDARVRSLIEGRSANAAPVRTRVIASTSSAKSDDAPTTDHPQCPKCGGDTWDNRAKKASGEFKSNAPDFSCKDKSCGGKVWPARDGSRASNTQGEIPGMDTPPAPRNAVAEGH